MTKAETTQFIVNTLEELYPKTPVPLSHTSNYTLLIAVLLSAQCTDERVNKITPKLFAIANNPYDMVKLSVEQIANIVRSVVMSQGFGVPAFPVDTHIHRLAFRWKLSTGKSVKQTEKDLKRLFEKNLWNKLHLQIIFFGREYCPARGHLSQNCPICSEIGRKDMDKKWAKLKR